VVRFLPPLIVSSEQIDDIASIFREAVKAAVRDR
jgi:4-aminobutyrate aminotransferase-like enzyme